MSELLLVFVAALVVVGFLAAMEVAAWATLHVVGYMFGSEHFYVEDGTL